MCNTKLPTEVPGLFYLERCFRGETLPAKGTDLSSDQAESERLQIGWTSQRVCRCQQSATSLNRTDIFFRRMSLDVKGCEMPALMRKPITTQRS